MTGRPCVMRQFGQNCRLRKPGKRGCTNGRVALEICTMTRGAGQRAMPIAVMGDGAAIRRRARCDEHECGWQQKEEVAHWAKPPSERGGILSCRTLHGDTLSGHRLRS